MNMGIFGKVEEYSKAAYDELAQEKKLRESAREQSRGMHPFGSSQREIVRSDRAFSELLIELQKKMDELLETAQQEGNKLNKEYNRLLLEAKTALERLAKFEQEKLRLHGTSILTSAPNRVTRKVENSIS